MINNKINYDIWANRKVFECLENIKDEALLTQLTRLFAHLFKAQVTWYNRVNDIQEPVTMWGDYTLEDCQSLLNDSPAMLEGIAAKIGTEIKYQNSKGETYINNVADIFEHIIIHGQHHRAQIFMLLRKAGHTPPSTDYIFFRRSL